jgi:hypothetical protein
MKRTGSAASDSKSNGSSTKGRPKSRPPIAAALCLNNGGCGDLEPRKIYRILPDKKAAAEGLIRVVDDSGEDYLYPSKYFALVRVPAEAAKKILVA